ncbi:MAG: hypothetical protein DMF11_06820 [Verrucomicrobia bacterium]|nr:MAG: hypothetical protein DMF11_06820 [Verrucomicrobiota bacterium]
MSNIPRRAAITSIVICAVVRPAGFLRRRVKADVAEDAARSQRYAEVLNPAIQILIINNVLVMPHSVIRSSHFVADEENAVVAGIRLVLSHRGAGSRPSHDSGLRAHGRAVR